MTEEDLQEAVLPHDVVPGPTWLWVVLGLVVAVLGPVTIVWMLLNGTGPIGPAPEPSFLPAN